MQKEDDKRKEATNERDVRNSRTADEMENHKRSSKHLTSRRGGRETASCY
jgi:hypothetical protein